MVVVPLTIQERILEYCTFVCGSKAVVGRLTVVCRAWIQKLAHVRQVYLLRCASFHRRLAEHLQPTSEYSAVRIHFEIETSDLTRRSWQLVDAAQKDWSIVP